MDVSTYVTSNQNNLVVVQEVRWVIFSWSFIYSPLVVNLGPKDPRRLFSHVTNLEIEVSILVGLRCPESHGLDSTLAVPAYTGVQAVFFGLLKKIIFLPTLREFQV